MTVGGQNSRALGVSPSGFFPWQDRPAWRRQQQDMVYLAHIRTAFALSNGTSGSPRMHRDLVDEGHVLSKRGILISMSGRGNFYDHSMALSRETSPLDWFLILLTFFRTIKSELVCPVAWQSRQQAENAVARYIKGFHNPVRRHSSLDFQSPIAFERKAREVS